MRITTEGVVEPYQVKCRACQRMFTSVMLSAQHECGQGIKEIPEPLEPITGDDVYNPHEHWTKYVKPQG